MRERRARRGAVALGRGAARLGEMRDGRARLAAVARRARPGSRARRRSRPGCPSSARARRTARTGAPPRRPAARGRSDRRTRARAPAGRRRSRPRSRGRRTSRRSRAAASSSTPSAPAEGVGVVVGAALEVDAPVPGERDEEDVAPVDRRMLVVEDPLHGQRLVAESSAVSTITNAFSVRGPSSGISSEVRTFERAPSAPIAKSASSRRRPRSRTVDAVAATPRRRSPASLPDELDPGVDRPRRGAAARSRPAAGSSRPGCTPAGGGG